ncbi:hypothetical protein ACFOU2_11055 [Bacillus songklensis]|uniref:Group-specific protein n=2 Tax=Bacillus songklensis TaxID=1069116 RepID=A0ABV8B167_9BACI
MNHAIFQFIFPFIMKGGSESSMVSALKKRGFERFRLDNLEAQDRYYGKFSVHHADMEHYYLPFTNKILFPQTETNGGFQRYSKNFNLSCSLKANKKVIPFTLLSADVVICPYELAFLTIRTEIADLFKVDFSSAIEFGARFRVLEPRRSEDVETIVEYDKKRYDHVGNFLFKFLIPHLDRFFDKKGMAGSYFETFPFFEDERMFVQSLFSLEQDESIESVDVYRAGSLDGLDSEGNPYISSNNPSYIRRFLRENSYEKWAPNTYYVLEKNSFSCLTNENERILPRLASQMYGEYYYGLLLNLFHKIVLLKIDKDYSEVSIDRDAEKVEKLIHSINTFTANYFFIEFTTQSQGREIFLHLKNMLNIDALYDDARQTLQSLYKYQEAFSSKKNSLLLLILTLYTVVGGIYGMNQVIEDLKGNIRWEKMGSYSIFEYIALFVTMSGLIVTVILGMHELIKWRKGIKKRKRWEAQAKCMFKR